MLFAGTLLVVAVSLGVLEVTSLPLSGPRDRFLIITTDDCRQAPGRLVGWVYAPRCQFPAGTAVAGQVISSRLREAAERGSPRALHDRGITRLSEARLEESVADLERAATISPADAKVLSDLSAALLARAESTGFRDHLAALSAAERAIGLDRRLAEGRFNQAMALESLALDNDAVAAWSGYLALDSTSRWADEARSHRAALERNIQARQRPLDWAAASTGDPRELRRLVASHPQSARQFIEEKALPSWARLTARGKDAEAVAFLASARVIGGLLFRMHGDGMLAESVAVVDRATAGRRSSRELRSLIDGHVKYQRALDLLNQGDTKQAAELFAQSRRALLRGGSPFARWATCQLGLCAYQDSDYRRERELVAPLTDPRLPYPALRSRAHWILGLAQFVQGDLVASLASYRSAARLYAQLGELANAGSLEDLIAEDFRILGQPKQASFHLERALATMHRMGDVRRRVVILFESASSAVSAGEPGTALRFQDEMIRSLTVSSDRMALAEALLSRADTERVLRGLARAEADVAAARQAIDRVAGRSIREWLKGDALNSLGTALRPVDPSRALPVLTEAIRLYRQGSYTVRLAPVRLERALAYEALGQKRRAELDLARALREVERSLAGLTDRMERAAFHAQASDLFHELILLAAERGEKEKAFEYSERGRSEVVIRSSPTLKVAEIEAALPSEVTLIGYSAVRDRLLIWAVRRNGVRFETSPLSVPAVTALVANLRSAILGGRSDGELHTAAKALYEGLLSPVRAEVDAATALELLPDGSLWSLPFAALEDPTSGHYLIEDHAVGVAPDASLYLASLARDRLKPLAADPTALIVGDPAFREDLLDWLPRLPAAQSEAERVAALYRHPVLLLSEAATKSAFLQRIGSSEVIHFAGHSLMDRRSPLATGLVFAADRRDGQSGVLTLADFASAELTRTRVVVLSACQTAREITADGSTGLASQFVVMGVPAVVASLWSVLDTEPSGLLTIFHQQLRGGSDVATALQRAQLEELRRRGRGAAGMRRWAAFEMVGGVERPSRLQGPIAPASRKGRRASAGGADAR